MEAAGQEQIPILSLASERRGISLLRKKMHPASIKLVQHFRQEGLKKTSSFCRPQKSFKGRALTGSVKLKSNQKRDDEKVEGLDLTFIESSHHNNLVPFFQKDEIF